MTELTFYSWPSEPLQMIITKGNGQFSSVSDRSCAYHQIPLSLETHKLTRFIIGGNQYTYTRGFYGLCGISIIFSQLMTVHLDPLIKKKQAITYIDDTVMRSQNKNEIFTVTNEYHTLLRKAGLKAAPDKTFFSWRKLKFLVALYLQKESSPSQNELRTRKISNQPKVNETPWKFLDALDSTVAISGTSMWIVTPSTIWLRTRLLSTGHTITKDSFKKSKTELAKTRFSPCPLLTIFFTFTRIYWTLELAVI